ncbi:oligosaccharide flippase family protein [Slackia piriformis]
MNVRKLLSDMAIAFGAQGVSFLCSVITTLLVPKVLGLDGFSYWQLFIFYTSYVSFFQLGLNDGVYLRHGGQTRDRIDIGLIRGELHVGLIYQSVAAFLISIYGIAFEEDAGRTVVVLAAAVFLLLSNTTFYISYVFQAMNETKLASYSTIVNRATYLISLVVCIFLKVEDFAVYVFFFLLSQAFSLLYCLWKARDFAKVAPLSFMESARETFRSMKMGIVLTLANVSGMLIMGMARIVIDAVWGLSLFGQVSLSLSIVNFALAFISQAAMVLFPALRMLDSEQERVCFIQMRDGLGVLLPVAMLLYAPLRAVVGLWLPEYAEGLFYLALLFPVCLFEMQTNLTVATFLKVRCAQKALLCLNLAALCCTLLAQCGAVFIINSPVAVLLASLFGVSVRYVLGMRYLEGVYRSKNSKMIICITMESVLFVCAAYFLSLAASFLVCVFLVGVHYVVCRKETKSALANFRRISGVGRGADC